ncbi:MAG: serine hydrolase, partial [Chloroflexi bacterium]|nr:serine hydrolase [Chloroflexota bacterium]
LTGLDRAIREGRTLTDDEVALLEPMITMSENDPAFELWAELAEGEAVAGYLHSIGITTFEPGRPGNWAASRISPKDLALLLTMLAGGEILDAPSLAFALDLMGSVVPEQDWGVTAGAPDGASVLLKNGWVYTEPDDWWVNSAGIVYPADGASPYAIVVLTSDQVTKEEGIAAIERIVSEIHAALEATPR